MTRTTVLIAQAEPNGSYYSHLLWAEDRFDVQMANSGLECFQKMRRRKPTCWCSTKTCPGAAATAFSPVCAMANVLGSLSCSLMKGRSTVSLRLSTRSLPVVCPSLIDSPSCSNASSTRQALAPGSLRSRPCPDSAKSADATMADGSSRRKRQHDAVIRRRPRAIGVYSANADGAAICRLHGGELWTSRRRFRSGVGIVRRSSA